MCGVASAAPPNRIARRRRRAPAIWPRCRSQWRRPSRRATFGCASRTWISACSSGPWPPTRRRSRSRATVTRRAWRSATTSRRRRHSSRTCARDRKSTRLNSSHTVISYAVFCLKKKKIISLFERVSDELLHPTLIVCLVMLTLALLYHLLRHLSLSCRQPLSLYSFFNDTATTEIYTLSLHDALPISYEKALEVTRNRYQAGVAQRYDVTQAQTQLENVRAQHVDLGITRATLEHAIAVLVGRPPAALSIPRKEQAPAIPAIPLTLPSQLLERRPDIAAAERRAAAANAQIGIARAAWFPTLSLGGSEGYASSGFSGLFQVPNRFWSLGPDLVGTLVDFGARRYQVR